MKSALVQVAADHDGGGHGVQHAEDADANHQLLQLIRLAAAAARLVLDHVADAEQRHEAAQQERRAHLTQNTHTIFLRSCSCKIQSLKEIYNKTKPKYYKLQLYIKKIKFKHTKITIEKYRNNKYCKYTIVIGFHTYDF